MGKRLITSLIFLTILLVTACGSENTDLKPMTFGNASVHDPSIIKTNGSYYVFGSHLAAAKSDDLIHWTMVADKVRPNNAMFPDVDQTLKETLEWAETRTFWAPDVTQLDDGQYYFYYNACRGDSPLSALGVAVSDAIEGPYEDLGIILKSGMWGQESEDGTDYDANIHPNVVDPHTFFDQDGQLWMVYGSYSGGIFILEMDPESGLPYENQGYGKKLLGGYHARIEGPYILYSPDTAYYYLFLSFGGLDSNGGYNIRVARSKNPDGPYYDSEGQDMIDAKGIKGQIFYDAAYEAYGYKLMGNFQFNSIGDEMVDRSNGYKSPGHNSAYYDEENDKNYLIFHTRFPNSGEKHEIRVHQFFFNTEAWPVVAPYRYAGETIAAVNKTSVIGNYQLIDHGHDISSEVHESYQIELLDDGTIIGDRTGTWQVSEAYNITLVIDSVAYVGVLLEQYDENMQGMTMTFTVGSEAGVSLWAIKVHGEE